MTGGMKTVGGLGALLCLGLLATAFLAGGCGSPPPCEVSTLQVQEVQQQASAAEEALQRAREERADMEAELRANRDQLRELEERKAKLQEERRAPR